MPHTTFPHYAFSLKKKKTPSLLSRAVQFSDPGGIPPAG